MCSTADYNEQSVSQPPPQRPKPLKTKEDRLKTKGRQIRYIIHSELVNFMVPEDVPIKRDVPILNRLVGKQIKMTPGSEPVTEE